MLSRSTGREAAPVATRRTMRRRADAAMRRESAISVTLTEQSSLLSLAGYLNFAASMDTGAKGGLGGVYIGEARHVYVVG